MPAADFDIVDTPPDTLMPLFHMLRDYYASMPITLSLRFR
jgi:hypothetical protein